MSGLLIDTDVLIDHFRGARPFQPPRRAVAYSIITRCELFAGRQVDEKRVNVLLETMVEIPIDRAIAEAAGRLRRNCDITTPDALIAATALERDLSLVTRNAKHFSGVGGLNVRSPG